MKRLSIFFALLTIMFSMSACVPKYREVPLGEYAPEVYEEQPKTIVILPPMNRTTAADAPIYYSTTLYAPIVKRGFYVFPYDVTTRILMDNGFVSTEEILSGSLAPFKEYFDADAVLFSTIHKWDLSYLVLAANLSVDLECTLRSTVTGKDLWNVRKNVVIDLTGTSNSGHPLVDLVVKTVATAIAAAASDYVPYAHNLMTEISLSLPAGPYSPDHIKDQNKSSGLLVHSESILPIGTSSVFMSSPKEQKAFDSSMATITFFRPTYQRDNFQHTPIVEKDASTKDINLVCVLASGTKFQTQVRPGSHTYAVFGEVGKVIQADVEAGKHYYVRIDPTMGWANVRFTPYPVAAKDINSDDVQQKLASCTLVEANNNSSTWFTKNKEQLIKMMNKAEKTDQNDENRDEKKLTKKLTKDMGIKL